MDLFRLVFKSLSKQKIRPYLIILQLFIGFFALTMGFGMIEGTQNYVNEIKKLSSPETLRLASSLSDTKIDVTKLKEFYENIQNCNDVLHIGTFFVTNMGISNMDISHAVFVDASFVEMYKFKVAKGKSFFDNSISKKTNNEIPILVGNNLSKKFPLNSIHEGGIFDDLKMKIVPKKFIVIGILPPNMTFWSGNSSTGLDSSLIKDDSMIVIPMQNEQNYGFTMIMRIESNLLLQIKDINRKDDFLKFADSQINEAGLSGKFVDLKTQIIDLNNQTRVQRLFSIAFAFLLLCLSSFGLIGVILASIIRRKRELGIRYALGSTPLSLALLIYGEIVVLFVFSFLLGIFLSWTLSNILPESLLINIGILTLMETVGTVLLLSILAAFIPIVRIIRTKPINLISGGKR